MSELTNEEINVILDAFEYVADAEGIDYRDKQVIKILKGMKTNEK